MKKHLSTLLLGFITSFAVAQQDAQFSQNMFNKLAINPGYAGSNNAICGTVLGRQQWMRFSDNGGTPETFLLSLDAPVKVLWGGLGLNLMQDKIGQEKTFAVNLSYAFRKAIGPGELALGINGGVLNKRLNSGNWKTPQVDYLSDQAIPNENISQSIFDLGFGIYYNIANQLYFGISSTHLPASTISTTGGIVPTNYNFDLTLKRHYYVMAGYNYSLGSSWDLKPSVFVKTEGSSAQVDLNCNIMYDQTFWGGLTYRHNDAIVPMFGFQQGTLKVGIAYDVTTSKLKDASSLKGGKTNTYELMVGYCYKIPEKNVIQKKKNVRFL